jgi:hypothetical protein
MGNNAHLLEPYGERCSHCGTPLEACPDDPPTSCICGRCGCIFFEGEDISSMNSLGRDPACRIGLWEISEVK